ncbi:hypothetical protein C8R46DRAFT_286339 [Mycena filopes]|nr:hypothetical protein C8R46DRAFT_286339 [Mycena filopes]
MRTRTSTTASVCAGVIRQGATDTISSRTPTRIWEECAATEAYSQQRLPTQGRAPTSVRHRRQHTPNPSRAAKKQIPKKQHSPNASATPLTTPAVTTSATNPTTPCTPNLAGVVVATPVPAPVPKTPNPVPDPVPTPAPKIPNPNALATPSGRYSLAHAPPSLRSHSPAIEYCEWYCGCWDASTPESKQGASVFPGNGNTKVK